MDMTKIAMILKNLQDGNFMAIINVFERFNLILNKALYISSKTNLF